MSVARHTAPMQHEAMQESRQERILSALYLALLLLAVLWPLWSTDWWVSAEGLRYPIRAGALSENLWAQGAHPRWIPEAGAGLGKPYFNYYAPGFAYLCLPFSWIGPVGATKLVILLVTCAAALAAFSLGRDWGGLRGGCLAALICVAAPYPVFNLYTRGDLAEYTANHLGAVMLLVLWRLINGGVTWRGALGCALLFALVVIQHNISALVLTGVFAAFAAGLAKLARVTGAAWARLGLVFVLGLALSAWFWLPALVELPMVHSDVLIEGVYDPSNRLISEAAPFARWSRSVATLGPVVPAVACLLLLAGALRLVPRGKAWLVAGGVIALVLLTLPVSWLFWDHAPLAKFIQFPWRLFGAANLLAATGAALVCRLEDRPGPARLFARPGLQWIALVGALYLVAGVWCISLRNLRVMPVHEPALNLQYWQDGRGAGPHGLVLTIGEFLPKDADFASLPDFHGSVATSPDLKLRVRGVDGASCTLSNETGKSGTVFIRQFWFPTWYAEIDGTESNCRAGPGGCLAVDVPAGSRSVRVFQRRTGIEFGAEWLSALALTGALAALGWMSVRRHQRAAAGEGS